MPESPELSPTICPRCGYDLDGIVRSWEGQWPLRGVCSECGLEFCWRDVFLAECLVLKGFFEHASGLGTRLAWAWRTWLWALWPPLFWRKVGLRHPPRVRGILLWPIFSIVLLWALLSLIENVGFLMYATDGLKSWDGLGTIWMDFAVTWTAGFAWVDHAPQGARLVWNTRYVPPIAGPGLAATLTGTLVLFCLPWTRAASRIRAGHVLRVAIYGLAWLAVPLILAIPRILSNATVLFSVGLGNRVRVRLLEDADMWTRNYWYVALALVAAWILVWWVTAVRTLFVGRNPGRILAAVLIPALLAFLSALFSSWDFIRTMGLR